MPIRKDTNTLATARGDAEVDESDLKEGQRRKAGQGVGTSKG